MTTLQEQWLKLNKAKKCKCVGYTAKRKPKCTKSTVTTSSKCSIVKSSKPTITKADKVIHIHTTIKLQIDEFTSNKDQRREDSINAMLALFNK